VEHAEAFLRDQITAAQRALIAPTIKQAYEAADLQIRESVIFTVPSAQDNRGRIIQWAVDFAFQRLVESQQWPFDFRWTYFERPTGRYLEILPSHSVLTISQVSDPSKQPRDVLFRANKRLNAQGWFRGMEPDDFKTAGIPHILLIHGHQAPNFAHLGIPRVDQESGYYFRTANLMQMPHLVMSPEPPPENTDIEAVITLKEEIDKWRRDNVE
jgi:hypothetical protein